MPSRQAASPGRASASKRIEADAARWRHQPHEILHQIDRLDGWMLGAQPVVGVRLAPIEKAGGRTGVAMELVGALRVQTDPSTS